MIVLALPFIFAGMVIAAVYCAYIAGYDQGRIYEQSRTRHPSHNRW